jgi:hypothetical protein
MFAVNDRACVWCGGTPLTNEHAFPKWIIKRLQNGQGTITVGSLDRTGQASPKLHGPRRLGKKLRFLMARRVCEPCNTGWMNDLETDVQPYVGGMVAGFKTTLNSATQDVIAAWATKTAMMLTYTSAGHEPIHPDQLQWMYQHRTPPAGTRIWLAAYNGEQDGLCDIKHLTVNRSFVPEGRTNAAAHLITVAFGILVMQVWLWADPTHQAFRVYIPNMHTEVTERIWPLRLSDMQWPPRYAVDNIGFYRIAMTTEEMISVCLGINPV